MNEQPPRIYEHVSDEGLEVITFGLQAEQRNLNRFYEAVMQERTIRYAERIGRDRQ